MLPIVDTHQHLWDLDRFTLPWLEGAPPLAQSHLPADYAEATAGQEVARTVYMEVDVLPDQRLQEAEYVTALCEDPENPMAGAVLSGSPADPGFAAYLDSLADNGYFKGVRQVLHVPEAAPGACLQDAFVEGVRLLGRRQLSFDLCMRPTELGDAAELARLCPDTGFVLDHCGNADPHVVLGEEAAADAGPFAHSADQWKRDMDALGALPNVVCKISGIVARARPGWDAGTLAPTVNHCLAAFGPERVVFGGDWPVCNLGASFGAWATALRQIVADRPAEEQRRLLHDNAVAFYRL